MAKDQAAQFLSVPSFYESRAFLHASRPANANAEIKSMIVSINIASAEMSADLLILREVFSPCNDYWLQKIEKGRKDLLW